MPPSIAGSSRRSPNPGEGVRRMLRRREVPIAKVRGRSLRAAARELLEWRDFDAPWRHDAVRARSRNRCAGRGDLRARRARQRGRCRGLAAAARWKKSRRPIAEATRLETVRGRDYDALEAALLRAGARPRRALAMAGRGRSFRRIPRAEVFRAARRAPRRLLDDFATRAGANLAPLLRDELWPVVGIYVN